MHSLNEITLWTIIGFFVGSTALIAILFAFSRTDEDLEPEDDLVPQIHIKYIFRQCYNHRESLKAYHSELCRVFDCDPHSELGDRLAESVFDGRDFNDLLQLYREQEN